MGILHKIFGKSVIVIDSLTEETREGINKAYIPKFLYKPPFGYPRYANIPYIRYLAQTPYVEMCISTIIDELSAVPWDIVSEDGMEELVDDAEIEHIRNFFVNPNTNKESFEEVFIKMPIRDLLEVNAGILNKVYNLKEDLVEVVARDGGTFTKNPDIHGMYTDRADVLLPKKIVSSAGEVVNPFQQISQYVVRESAAYFQYGWVAGPIPVPFGKKELIWLEGMKRTDEHYGYSPVQILAKNLQTLLWMIESDLEYFNDNNVPKGIIGLADADTDEIKAFKEQWYEIQRKKDDFGNWKKLVHKVPIVNSIPKFERMEFSSVEMELIEKQKWYTKMVWASFGVTSTELGYTEDAKGSANQIVQSKVFRKKAINPRLRYLEYKYNHEIVSEFGYYGTIKTEKGKSITRAKYKFVFKTFDIDEERNKAELYKLQVETGLKTVNEIRKEEGLEELDWGDDPPSKWQTPQSSFNFGEGFNDREKEALKPDKGPGGHVPDGTGPHGSGDGPGGGRGDGSGLKKERKGIEMKPFAGYANFDDCVRKNQGKKDPEAYCAVIMRKVEGKDNPLILKENEVMDDAKLQRSIVYLLKQNEEEILKLLEGEIKVTTIARIKDFSSFVDKLKGLVSLEAVRNVLNKVIVSEYLKGWEEAEKEMDKNFVPDRNAMDYISKYTFENVKGMEDDIANKLRQELKRAYMNGEGITKIKERVKSVFDVGDNRAEMIARTETNRASNTGKLQAYQTSGLEGKKVWITHFDKNTSALCKRLDGQEVDLNENFKDPAGTWEGPSAPAHVNCRSGWAFRPE